jgi:hypothetical protein
MTVNMVREKINNTVTWDTPRVEFSVSSVTEMWNVTEGRDTFR